MNPLVRVEAVAAPGGAAPEALPPSFFAGFRAVVLAGASARFACAVNAACRAAGNVAFFAGEVGAEHGALFCDLGPTHTYLPQARPEVASLLASFWLTLAFCAQVKKADDDKPAPPPPQPITLQYCTLQARAHAPC
jgi:hypothetical protein